MFIVLQKHIKHICVQVHLEYGYEYQDISYVENCYLERYTYDQLINILRLYGIDKSFNDLRNNRLEYNISTSIDLTAQDDDITVQFSIMEV